MIWQPIETAPKDEIILLACDGYVHPGQFMQDGGCDWHFWDSPMIRGEIVGDDRTRIIIEANGWLNKYGGPTHWMPLPDPPTS